MQVLFRAKDKNSNTYVIGYEYYNHIEDEYYITHYISGSNYKVDRTTRSINIEDMLDSQGNKIFASLQKNGRGGDIVESIYNDNIVAIWQGLPAFRFEYKRLKSKYDREFNELLSSEIKIIGIQQ